MNFMPRIGRAPSTWLLSSLLIMALLGFSSPALGLDILPYLPHKPGNRWTYVNSNQSTMTTSFGSPVKVASGVTAIPATSVESDQPGKIVIYSTVDGNGFRRHQEYMSSVYVPGYGPTSATAVYSPALKLAPATVTVGRTYSSTGTVKLAYTNVAKFTLKYNSSTRVAGFETVSNNAGTLSWSALKVITSITISGTVNGKPLSTNMTSTGWMVAGLGTVRAKSNTAGVMETWKLDSTNVTIPAGPPAKIAIPVADADGSYTVSWTASATPGATYVLQEATNSAFTLGVRTVPHTNALKASISGNQPGKTYYYRVKARKAGYRDSTWRMGPKGCTVKFPAKVPASITIPASDPDGGYTVSWTASATPGVTYVLQEATDSAFTLGIRAMDTGTAKSAAISGRAKDKTYYYRVKAIKAGLKGSTWRSGANGCEVSPLSHTAWLWDQGDANPSASPREADVVVFLDRSHYLFAKSTDGSADPGCPTNGIEHGTYTWNPVNNSFSATATYKTPGFACGLDGANDTISISGNTLTIGGSTSFTRISRTANPLVGTWSAMDPISQEGSVLVFLDEANFMVIDQQTTPPPPDPDSCGQSGLEHGQYLWNQGNFSTSNVAVDSTGCWGLAGITPGEGVTVEISGNTMQFIVPDEGTYAFPRLY